MAPRKLFRRLRKLRKLFGHLLWVSLERTAQEVWYQEAHWLKYPLAVFAPFFRGTARTRRFLLKCAASRQHSSLPHIPVIVIGNITVGGNGKTALTIMLSRLLQQRSCRPGIVTRGYRGRAGAEPRLVTPDDDVLTVGDEALLLAQKTRLPVVVSRQRQRGVAMLAQHGDVDVILSDDGLQHYAMPRDIEIAIVENSRGFGNGMVLPAGPMREPVERLSEVDFVIVNETSDDTAHCAAFAKKLAEYSMPWIARRVARQFRNIALGFEVPLIAFADHHVHAFTAIANPASFLHELKRLGVRVHPRVFYDHYFFVKKDFRNLVELPVIMTEKDAVKCTAFADQRMWILQTELVLEQEDRFVDRLVEKLRKTR